MAFPTTSILDTFARADGGLGAAWTSPVIAGDENPSISNMAVIDTVGVSGSAYWNAQMFSDSECWVSVLGTDFSRINVYFRVRTPGASLNCYTVRFDQTLGVDIFRLDSGTPTASLFSSPSTIAGPGWLIGGSAITVGNSVVINANGNSGTGWTTIGSYTDPGILATNPALESGYIGFRQFGIGDNRYSFNNFAGGDPGSQYQQTQIELATVGGWRR